MYFETIPFIVYILQYGRSTLQLDSYKWFLRKRWRLWKIEYNNFRWRQNLKLVSFKLLFCSVRQENVLQSVLRHYFFFFLTNSIITLHRSCRIYLSSLPHSFQQKSRECIRIERVLYKCISLIVSFRKCTTKALSSGDLLKTCREFRILLSFSYVIVLEYCGWTSQLPETLEMARKFWLMIFWASITSSVGSRNVYANFWYIVLNSFCSTFYNNKL